MRSGMLAIAVPFCWRLGWHRTSRAGGQDSDGPLRQAPSRSLPSNRFGVEWMLGPGRRINIKTVRQPEFPGVRPGSSTHPNGDAHPKPTGGSPPLLILADGWRMADGNGSVSFAGTLYRA